MNHGMTLASVHSTNEVARTVRTPAPIGDYLPPHVSRQKMTVLIFNPFSLLRLPKFGCCRMENPDPRSAPRRVGEETERTCIAVIQRSKATLSIRDAVRIDLQKPLRQNLAHDLQGLPNYVAPRRRVHSPGDMADGTQERRATRSASRLARRTTHVPCGITLSDGGIERASRAHDRSPNATDKLAAATTPNARRRCRGTTAARRRSG
jgi:hypothetical protein